MEIADWVRAPNIASHPEVYERENEALARDGRLDEALCRAADPAGLDLLDIGCGTGFWLPRYADRARSVTGIEPDPVLLERARRRTAGVPGVSVLRGSAERLPLGDGSVDLAHARFAYFFGPGSNRGLDEVARVLRPGGSLLVVDNSWRSGDFAELLRDAVGGNADLDPARTDRWWREHAARRIEVEGGWHARSAAELQQILRIEFASEVVDRWLAASQRNRDASRLSYAFAVFVWRLPESA